MDLPEAQVAQRPGVTVFPSRIYDTAPLANVSHCLSSPLSICERVPFHNFSDYLALPVWFVRKRRIACMVGEVAEYRFMESG